MAIFHLHAQIISRKAGRSSTAACAYRSGERVIDRRTGEIHDYSRKRGVLHKQIVMPKSTDWKPTREELWNAVEEKNKRADAQVAREFVVALPDELSFEQQVELAECFGSELAEQYQIGVDYAMHDAGKDGDKRNKHVHFLTTTNIVQGHGLGNKQRELDLIAHTQTKEKYGTANAIDRVRERWEALANEALAKAGNEARIDRRTLEEQGIDDRLPQMHLGPTATAIERKGKRSKKGDAAREQQREFAALCKAEDEAQKKTIDELNEELQLARVEQYEQELLEQDQQLAQHDAEMQAQLDAHEADLERHHQDAPQTGLRALEKTMEAEIAAQFLKPQEAPKTGLRAREAAMEAEIWADVKKTVQAPKNELEEGAQRIALAVRKAAKAQCCTEDEMYTSLDEITKRDPELAQSKVEKWASMPDSEVQRRADEIMRKRAEDERQQAAQRERSAQSKRQDDDYGLGR